jgi:hypothetical protein
MVMTEPRSVFISHVSNDEAIALYIKAWLEELFVSIEVFVSGEDLRGGRVWAEVLRRRIPGAGIILTVLSPAALKSAWVLFESGTGFLEDKVVPLCVDELQRRELEGPFAILQARELTQSDLNRLLLDIERLTGAERVRCANVEGANYALIREVDDFCVARGLRGLQVAKLFRPYEKSRLQREGTDFHEEPINSLIAMIVTTVEVEEPVHSNVVLTRLRESFGLARAGGRIKERFEIALDGALRTGQVKWDRDRPAIPPHPPFLCVTLDGSVMPQRPSDGGHRRMIEEISPRELEAGLEFIHHALRLDSREFLLRKTAEEFGFNKLTSKVHKALVAAADRLGRQGKLRDVRRLRSTERSPAAEQPN